MIDEILYETDEHIATLELNHLESISVEIDYELRNRFIKTFYPDEHKKYFKYYKLP